MNHFFGGLQPVDGILTKKVYAASRVKIEARSFSLTCKLRYDIPRNIYSQNLWLKSVKIVFSLGGPEKGRVSICE